MSLACLAHVNFLLHMYFDLITEQINDDDDDKLWPVLYYLGHSFCNKPQADKGSKSSYNNAGRVSEVSEEVATQIAKNCHRGQPHSHLTPPPRGTPREYPHARYIRETSHHHHHHHHLFAQ